MSEQESFDSQLQQWYDQAVQKSVAKAASPIPRVSEPVRIWNRNIALELQGPMAQRIRERAAATASFMADKRMPPEFARIPKVAKPKSRILRFMQDFRTAEQQEVFDLEKQEGVGFWPIGSTYELKSHSNYKPTIHMLGLLRLGSLVELDVFQTSKLVTAPYYDERTGDSGYRTESEQVPLYRLGRDADDETLVPLTKINTKLTNIDEQSITKQWQSKFASIVASAVSF